MDFTVEIVSRNLATTSNFVEFRYSRNFTFFEAPRVIWDTWHMMSGSQGTTCQVWDKSNKSSSETHRRHVATHDWVEIKVDG